MIEWLFSGASDGSQRVVLTGDWSPWVQAAVIATCVAIFALTAWNYRGAKSRGRRAVLLALRAGILALLVFLFYQPAWVEESVQRSRNTVAVLLDDSESMTLPHGDSTRLAAERRLIERLGPTLDALTADNDVEVMLFSDGLREVERGDAALALDGRGKQTPLLETLERVREGARNRDLGGIVLISDGVDNGKLQHRIEGATGLDDETLRFVEALGVPIHTFGFTGDEALRDVAVQRLKSSSFAFHLNATALEATVRITGYPPGTTVRTGLYENGKLLTQQVLTVLPGKRDYDLTFEYVPRLLGSQVYAVAAERLPGEVYDGNNEKLAVVSVIRDRIRVLQICGHPSWDERFFRNHLKRNPSVDLISFFILINPRNAFAVSPDDTALIPFPAQELFVDELGGFDLIVFQDFNHGPFQTRQHLFRVRDFVKNGGAFLMLGGRLGLSEGGYYGTEITEVLPVAIPPSSGSGETLDEREFQARLTPAGDTHPVTRLALDPAANDRIWGSLPPLEGVNRVLGLAPDSVSLLEHPSIQTSSGPQPVVAVREVGEGRTMVVATDSTWRWSFEHAGEGGDAGPYSTFWDNAIRWLIRDPELELLRVSVERGENPLGDKVQGTVRVFGLDYKPAPGQPVSVTVIRRGGLLTWTDEKVISTMDDARTNDEGELPVELVPESAGVYEIRAKTTLRDRDIEASEIFLVLDDNPELRDVVAEQDVLALLSKASGGRAYSVSATDPALPVLEPRVMKITRRDRHELWSGVDVLLLAALLLGAEWWLRRRSGYL